VFFYYAPPLAFLCDLVSNFFLLLLCLVKYALFDNLIPFFINIFVNTAIFRVLFCTTCYQSLYSFFFGFLSVPYLAVDHFFEEQALVVEEIHNVNEVVNNGSEIIDPLIAVENSRIELNRDYSNHNHTNHNNNNINNNEDLFYQTRNF